MFKVRFFEFVTYNYEVNEANKIDSLQRVGKVVSIYARKGCREYIFKLALMHCKRSMVDQSHPFIFLLHMTKISITTLTFPFDLGSIDYLHDLISSDIVN